jgi:hypothetical protein
MSNPSPEFNGYYLCLAIIIEGTDVRGFVVEGPHVFGSPIPEGKFLFHVTHFRKPPVEGRIYTLMSTSSSFYGVSRLCEVVDGKYKHGYVMSVKGINSFRCVREITYREDPELSEGEFLMVGSNFKYEPLAGELYKYEPVHDSFGSNTVLTPVY